MENAGIFSGHLEYFTVIWNVLLSFGICGIVSTEETGAIGREIESRYGEAG
jgi:hypothetical protein